MCLEGSTIKMLLVAINKSRRFALIGRFSCAFLAAVSLYSAEASAQDLATGTELKDSPLSLSLSTSVPMSVGDQSQQLVISQYGILNKATVSQLANAGNSIIIDQQGINNVANLSQTGFGNTINLEQYGNGNLAEVIQEGDANIANINQQGEQTFIVHQIGNDMVVNITQY